jgi:asparagine synthase (glutamine-hydrolysing)
VKTFSIVFREKDHDESRYAQLIARRFETDHHELILEPDITGLLDDLAWHLDEPFGDPSAIPTYIVSRLAAQHVTVVLSGDGGDELFGGYDKYVVEGRERRYENMAAPLRGLLRNIAAVMPEGAKGRNFLRHFSLSGAERYLDAVSFFHRDEKRQLFQPEIAEQIRSDDIWRESAAMLKSVNGNWLSSLQYFDLKRYLPLDILTKVDRMSMAHSLEARVPLLDHKLVEFAGRIPPELKLNGTTKYVFKQALRGILPGAVIDRRKQGFAVPLGPWFRGRLEDFLRDHLLSPQSRTRGIFNTAYIERLIALHEQGRPLGQQLWTLLSFELWCRTFLDQKPEAIPVLNKSRGAGAYARDAALSGG